MNDDPVMYYSTNLKTTPVSFREALLKGLAPDRGLFMPESIPTLSDEDIRSFKGKEYHEIAFRVIKEYTRNQVPDEELYNLVKDAYNFEVPLEKVYGRNYILRLDQGPTASFKDFAARMMGRLMQYFLKKENRKMLILTATSGDTGSAIANAFYGLDNIKVVVLFPDGEVTDRQRKQMTTLEDNIQIVSLKGKFDDCQAMVKKAFSDHSLDYLPLSSANSINIGRLIPQSVYYFYAYSQLFNGNLDDKVNFVVPSGNFGNLMGGILAKNMGLPVKRFVIATNENDEVPVFLNTDVYHTIVPSVNCISSAMNVGHPSNMARIIALYGGMMNEKGVIEKKPDLQKLKQDLWAVSIDDHETRETIINAYKQHKLLLEPHGAVGWAGLMNYFKESKENGREDQLNICLETAHPAKFPAEINELLKFDPELPESLKGLDDKKEHFVELENKYELFKQFLKDNY